MGGRNWFARYDRRKTLLEVSEQVEKRETGLDMPKHGNPTSEPIVAWLRSITEEIDDLTKAILDTITLETALKSTRLREKATAGAGGS